MTLHNRPLIHLFTLIVLTACCKGQNALTAETNEPRAGYSEKWTYCDTSEVVDNSYGVNKIWDFSSLLLSANDSVVNYSAVPNNTFSALFTNANLVEDAKGLNFYYKTESTSSPFFEFLGIGDSASQMVLYNSAIEYYWPVTYNQTSSDSFAGNYNGQVEGTIAGLNSYSATGTGSLLLPGNIFYQNVIQITRKTTIQIKSGPPQNSTTYNNTVTDYIYFDINISAPLLKIRYAKLQGYNSFDAQVRKDVVTDLKNYNYSDLLTIKQARDGVVKVTAPFRSSVELIDLNGKAYKPLTMETNNEEVSHFENIPPNVYIIKVTDNSTTRIKKILVE